MNTIKYILENTNIPRVKLKVEEALKLNQDLFGLKTNHYRLQVSIYFLNTEKESIIFDEILYTKLTSVEECSKDFVSLLADIIGKITMFCANAYKNSPELFENIKASIIDTELTPEENTLALLNVLDSHAKQLNDKTEL